MKEKNMDKGKIQYALNKDNKLISINEAERGLACNCFCQSCKSPLLARKGSKKIPHFAHYKNPTCETGYQTSIHLLAIKLIAQRKMIKIPPVYCEKYYEDFNEGYRIVNEKIRGSELLKDVEVYQETKENGLIPDIIVQLGSHKLYVEIYVTHKVDEEKKKKVKENDISMIEIDLSDVNREIPEDELEDELSKYLFEDTSKSYWINNKILNIEYQKQQAIKNNFIEKHKRYEQNYKKNNFNISPSLYNKNQRTLSMGKCPICFSPLIKSQLKIIMITCSKNINHIFTLTPEQENNLLKKLENEPVYDYQQFHIHNNICPNCKANLFIQTDKSGPFIKCTECDFRLQPEQEKYLSKNLKEVLAEYRKK